MLIRSKTLRWLIILSTVLVTIIVVVQLFWLQKIYRFERKQFNSNVVKSIKGLFNMLDLTSDSTFTFEKNIELPQEHTFIAKIDKIRSIDSISSIFSKELTDFDILTDCKISIYSVAEKKYIASKYIDIPDSYNSLKDDFSIPIFNRKYSYLSISFPHRSRYIIMQMLFWIISSGILLIVLIGFGISVFYLYHQQFLNETQKDFVNNFTHEFKTPLSVIKIAADVLQQHSIIEKPEKLKNYADIIKDQTAHLQNQLNRMLVVAYTEHSTLPLQKELFDANKLLQQAVNNIQPLIEERSGSLVIASTTYNSFINADKSYILLAYINILENAVKYSVKPVIEVTTYVEGSDFCIDIKDEGIGIDKKQQGKIFNKFYRVTDGDIHQSKGFGLGLNFVKKIMDAHRGNISVESALGKGSTFTIKIPRN
ncbi:MAG: HAMP domain-containing sensor histidine kinase [Ferruginibacter sp.]